MAYKVIYQNDSVTDTPIQNAILSIQLRLNGLSFSVARDSTLHLTDIAFTEGGLYDNLSEIFRSTEVLNGDFSTVNVCIPTDKASLIPPALDVSESHARFFAVNGVALSPDEAVISTPCKGEKTLLMVVSRQLLVWLHERFGEKVRYVHPLSVSLNKPDENGRIIRIDTTKELLSVTVHRNAELRYADVFPLENAASVLLCVNRLTEAAEADKTIQTKIICSGTNCKEYATFLRNYYSETETDPNGEYRNLYAI